MTPSLSFLVDSSADNSFINQDLVTETSIPSEILSEPKTVLGLNRESLAKITHQTAPLSLIVLGNNRERIQIFLIPFFSCPGVLGAHWLANYKSQPNWLAGRLTSWSVSCHIVSALHSPSLQ